jgi:hypothetical protein
VLDLAEKASRIMREITNREEWSLACLKGTLASYLHPGSIRKVTLKQFDGLKRRVQISYGVSEEKIKEAIVACMNTVPSHDPERAEEIRRRYLDN